MRTIYYTRSAKGRKLAYTSVRGRFFRKGLAEMEVLEAQGAPVKWFRRFDDTSEAGRLAFADAERDLPTSLEEAEALAGVSR